MMYDAAFYEAETKIAVESARFVLPGIVREGNTVIDIGCGTGGWASVAAELGCIIRAVDHGVPEHLQIVPVHDHDLTNGYDCTGWDLAICLEVAEHLPETAEQPLISGLAGATRVLFSAATPGQPGINHINCRPHSHWHDRFAIYGLYPTHIGPRYGPPVADFYQRNMFLYERTP